MVMLNINCIKRIKKNEAGFTFIELLIASAMSIVILGLLAHVFRSQQKEFGSQTELNTMQANARGATEFVARSVQNAGFNVKRGTRFLSATDHSMTAVYDDNEDGVIQNNEVITYYLANSWNGTATESNKFDAWFDVDNDGTIDSTEKRAMTVGMTVNGPPFNLYKVTPNAAGTGVERSLVARNIDNMVIKYYDKQGRLLPWHSDPNDTDGDTSDDIDFNDTGDDQPDNGLWTFNMPVEELNNIRKVEVELLGRSRNPSPREVISSGSYLPGSIAAVKSGSTTYQDLFYREEFTARMAPRNLTMAPWGNIDIVSNPATVNCPDPGSVTATLLDRNGEAVPSTTLTFTATGSGVTLDTPSTTTDANGERITSVDFDYSTPFLTTTVSASAQVDDGSGNLRPVYNATPVGFTFKGTNFIEPFDGSQAEPWLDLAGGALQFDDSAEYFVSTAASGTEVGAVNGCLPWRDYSVQVNLKQEAGTTWADSTYMGLLLRHSDANNYYWITLHKKSSGPPTRRFLRILKRVGGTPGLIIEKQMDTIPDTVGTAAAFADDTTYTLKAQILGNDIRVKIWKTDDLADPNASEPPAWELGGVTPVTDSDLTSGNLGLISRDPIFQFDDVSVNNPAPIS